MSQNQDVKQVKNDSEAISQEERRRLMYERIARGNALAEVEDNAHRIGRRK